MLNYRTFITSFLVLFLFCFINGAQEVSAGYPEKEIRIITSTGPGGGVDRMARSVQRFLPDILGVSVLVENRKGAGGKIGFKYVMKQPPDGYTIWAYHQPGFTNMIKKNPGLANLDDLAFININWIDPTLLAAHKDMGWKSLDDFIKDAKKNPGKYSFAAPGASSAGAIMPQMLFNKLGLDIRIVAYGGGGSARASLMGHHTDMTAGGAAGMLAVEKVAVPLGVFSDKRIASWPDAVPINESLAKYNIRMPNAGSYRFFAVHRKFKETYPDRWKILVDGFKKLILEHKGFQEFCDKGAIGRDWFGPEKTLEIVKEVDEAFLKIKLPK
ncbi:MAG: tripartite tricarboxylate transporter substrate binding protein [Deltaproteobacteria bacterium]|nr:tripartite tricarboxylate transporter substrate binding protein [Deltaproteobacteria bacterium]MBW2150525.1 tripartite tricarboxylate transporter substrate binding protein [Deltaproteobacteria bacterium]